MTTLLPISDYSGLSVGDIAATLPGAAALFRDSGINFCCGGDVPLAEAAAKRGLEAGKINAALAALASAAGEKAPDENGALIAHIRTRFHDTHRRELTGLIPLAQKVEEVHGGHPDAPAGLAGMLMEMAAELDSHMLKEELVLFPMMLEGGHPMIVPPIARMREEHDSHASSLRALEHITHGFRLPEDACRSWQALYAGTAKFAEDLVAHMHIENTVLFPRFETEQA